jgi:hypothetical protein
MMINFFAHFALKIMSKGNNKIDFVLRVIQWERN